MGTRMAKLCLQQILCALVTAAASSLGLVTKFTAHPYYFLWRTFSLIRQSAVFLVSTEATSKAIGLLCFMALLDMTVWGL